MGSAPSGGPDPTGGSESNQFLLLPGLELLRLTSDRFDEQRQTRVHHLLLRLRVTFPPRLRCFLFAGGRFLCGRGLLSVAALLLLQEALRGSGLLEAGVGGVQVEEVGGEHGLEARVLDVHLMDRQRHDQGFCTLQASSGSGDPESHLEVVVLQQLLALLQQLLPLLLAQVLLLHDPVVVEVFVFGVGAVVVLHQQNHLSLKDAQTPT